MKRRQGKEKEERKKKDLLGWSDATVMEASPLADFRAETRSELPPSIWDGGVAERGSRKMRNEVQPNETCSSSSDVEECKHTMQQEKKVPPRGETGGWLEKAGLAGSHASWNKNQVRARAPARGKALSAQRQGALGREGEERVNRKPYATATMTPAKMSFPWTKRR